MGYEYTPALPGPGIYWGYALFEILPDITGWKPGCRQTLSTTTLKELNPLRGS